MSKRLEKEGGDMEAAIESGRGEENKFNFNCSTNLPINDNYSLQKASYFKKKSVVKFAPKTTHPTTTHQDAMKTENILNLLESLCLSL